MAAGRKAKRSQEWYTAAEAADYLGLHVDSVRRLCRQNQIEYRKLRGYQFSKAMLDAFLASRTNFQPRYPSPLKGRYGPRGQ